MSLPNSAYANLTLVPDAPKRSVRERKASALADASAESALKRIVERANDVLDALEAREVSLASQIKALQKRKAANAARIERIEDRALTLMQEAGLTTLAGVRCSWRSQPAAAALDIVDETLIPRSYFNTPKTPPATPDKVAIKKALAADDELDPAAWGCKLTSKISLIRK
jgi:hypothetical protein